MNKFISNSIIACFLIYTLFLSNFAFVAGESILDNDSVVDPVNDSVELVKELVENVSSPIVGENETSEGNQVEKTNDSNLEEDGSFIGNYSGTNSNESEGVIVDEENVSDVDFNITINDTNQIINDSEIVLNESFNSSLEKNDTVEQSPSEEKEGGVSEEKIFFERDFEVEVIQGFAEVEEGVIWVKKIYSAPENVEVVLPEGGVESSRVVLFDEERGESYVKIEYETLPPKKEEKEISKGKEVLVWSEDHYENVYTWTEIDESLDVRHKEEISIKWIEKNEEIKVKDLRDRDGNGIYDYVGWVVPHLSNQTFHIIVINVAEHLDSDREFIEDIYSEVKAFDGVWSPVIEENEFVRVVFEEELDSTNDITIVSRNISGNPVVEVYEKNSEVIIAEFDELIDNFKNKIYLTNLVGKQDVFDLKVVGGSLQFDYIVDPDLDETYNFSSYTEASNGDWLYESNTGGSWTNVGLANEPSANGNAPQWQWVSNGGSASSGTGPPTGYSCVFPETSTPFASGDEARITLQENYSADEYDLFVTFDHSTYGVANGYTYFEAWNGTNYNVIDSWAGDSNTAMQSEGPYDFSATGYGYENEDFHIRFRILVGSTSYQNDFAVDSVRIYGNFSNRAPSIPTSLTCNGGSCGVFVDDQVELNCSGSTDLDGDLITYVINDSNGYVGNHTSGNSFVWNTSLVSETSGVNFTCEAYDFGGSNESLGPYNFSSNLGIDHTFPLVNFGSGMIQEGLTVNANSIFVNVSVIEDNFENITFELYSSQGLISSDSYFGSTRSITWNDLSDKIYFYNVSVWDKAGHLNFSSTGNLTLDKVNPSGSTSSPSSGTHSNQNSQNLTVDISDAIGLKEAVLNVFNSSGALINSTSILVGGVAATIGIVYNFVSDGIYNWFYRIFDKADNFYDAENSTIVIDTLESTVFLESVLNNSGDTDGNLIFDFNVTDDLSDIENCSLVLNEVIVDSEFNINKNNLESFSYGGLGVGSYNWSIQCYDGALNFGESEKRYFDVVSVDSFSGSTTDLSLEDLSNVSDFVLENNNGKISYLEDLDLTGGLDFDSLVDISSNYVFVDSLSENNLNASAVVEMYGLNYEFIPVILKDGSICSDCEINYYSLGNLSFNVSSFSNYSLGENSKLEIFDESENSDKYVGDNVVFYANYTNRTSGSPITSSVCDISFDDGNYSMNYNSGSGLYEYNRSFASYGVKDYSVVCYGSSQGYENLTVSNSLSIKFGESGISFREGFVTQSGVYNFVGVDEFIPLDIEVSDLNHAFVLGPNLMNQENTSAGTGGDPAMNSRDSFASLYLYNSTHIRVQRNLDTDGPIFVTWQVLEAMNEEFEVQRGLHYYSGSSATTSVDISKNVSKDDSMSWFYINTSYASNDGDKIQFYSDLIDNDTLQFTREHSGVSTDVSFRWIVVEWDQNKINSFQKGYTGSITGDDISPDCYSLGENINKSSSILFHHSHAVDDSDGGLDSSTRAGYIQDDSTVCFYDYDSGFYAGVKWYLIDFGGTTGREENTNTFWGTTDYSDSVSFSGSYERNKTLFFVSATSNGDGTAKPRHTQWWYLTGDNPVDGLNIERTYGGQDREYSWQVLELPYYENLDAPRFFNYSVNQSFGTNGDSIRFSVEVNDSSNSINWTKGIVGGVEINFTKGLGDLWYYDYSCVSDETVSFSYVVSEDNGQIRRQNSTGISGVELVCDSTSPIVSFLTPNTPIDQAEISETYFDIDVNLTEINFLNISYELWNSTSLVNRTSSSSEVESIRFENIDSGTYYYNVTVYDVVGNKNFTETRSVIFDRDGPQIDFGLGMYGSGSIVSSDEIFVNVSIVEDNFENVTFYIYDENMIKERTPVTYADSRRSLTWTLLSEDLYFVEVMAFDSFGNSNSTGLRNITLDTTDPIVDFTSNTKEDDYYYDRDFIFAEVTVDEQHFENLTFYLYNSSGLVSSSFFNDSTRSITWDYLDDGEYFYNVSSYDEANNFGFTETRKITLDSVNPIVSYGIGVENDSEILNHNFVYINVSVVEDNFKNITFRLFEKGGSIVDSYSFYDITKQYNFTGLVSDIYEYNVTVYDKANNYYSTFTREITLDINGPIVNIENPKSIAYGVDTGLALDYTSFDEFSSVDSCWWNLDDGQNNSIICGTNTTFDTNNGEHTIKFYSNDSFGNVGEDSVTFLISTGGPAIILNSPEEDSFYSSETEVLFNYSATDVQGVSSCSLYGDWGVGWHLNQTDYGWEFKEDKIFFDNFDDGALGSNWTIYGSNGYANMDVRTDSSYSGAYSVVSDSNLNGNYELSELITSRDFSGAENIILDFYWMDSADETNAASDHTNHQNSDGAFFTCDGNQWYVISDFQPASATDQVWNNVNVNLSADPDFCSEVNSSFAIKFTQYDNYVWGTDGIAFDDINISYIGIGYKSEGNFSVNFTQEGNYLWNVECNDTLGLVETALNNYSISLDLTFPQVDFGIGTLSDGDKTANNYIYINASVIENNLKNITFYLFDDSGFVKSKTYFNDTTEYTFSSLNSGNYYYNFTVFDKALRSNSSLTRSLEIDLDDPSGSLIQPIDEFFTKNKTWNFTATVSDLSELLDATLFIYNSTGGLVFSSLVGLSGLTSATIGIIYSFIYDDVFDWFYRVRDSVGNEYNTTSYEIEIDSTSPVINFISPTQGDGDVVLRNWIYLNTSIYEKNYKNITFRLFDSSGLLFENSFSNSKRDINWTLLPDDVYDYNVSSFDLAGNEGFSETREIILDTTSPIVDFSLGTEDNDSFISGDEIFINVSVIEPNEKNITFYLYDDGGVNIRKNSFVDNRRSVNWGLLSSGVYYYNVTVFDEVSLEGFTETRKITLDNSNPIVDFSLGTETDSVNKSQDWVFVNVTIDEDNIENISFNLFNSSLDLVDEALFTNGRSEYNFTGLDDGSYYYNVSVYDKSSNIGISGTRKINLDTVLPFVEFISSTENDFVIRNRDWVYVNASVVEDNFKEIKFSLYDSGGVNDEKLFSDSTREYNFTGLFDDNYEYNVTVYDWAGNENYTETRHIGLDGAGPEVNIIKPKSKTYGYNESLPLDHEVSDRVSSLDSCWWNIDGGQNQTINCNEDTTFNTTVDSHIINFYANDTFGNLGYDSVSFFISVTGPAVELVLPENDTFYSLATEVNFSFVANDPDSVDICSLYGDWGTGWQKNETYSGNWYDVGFKHRKDVGISNPGTSNLIDFPVYLNISSDHTYSGDYYDLRFFNGSCSESQTSLLPYEVEYYDINSADVWVRVPEISPSGSTICMYYGSDGAEELENITGTWGSDYALVYHMDNDGEDSTSNNRDRVAEVGSPTNDDSFLGEGISFGSGNAWDQTNLAWWEDGFNTRSHEVVFETSSNVNTRQVIFAEGGGTNGIMLYILSGQIYARWWSESTGFSGDYINTGISASQKYHAVMTYDYPGNYSFYLNGNLIGTEVTPTTMGAHSGDGGIGYTGSTPKDFHDASESGDYFLGSIFEFRGIDDVLTEEEVNQTYGFIFDENNFVSYSSEENFTAFSIPISEEGSYIWNVMCNDTIGYDSFGLDNYTFIVDVTNPEVFFGSGTEDNDSIVGVDWIYVDANVIENNFKNITFDLYDGGGNNVDSVSYSDSTREYNFTDLDSGVYFYNVTVYDKAERKGASETRLLKLDLSSPSGNLVSPSDGSYLKNLFQNLTASISDSTGLLNATLYVLNETGHLIYTDFLELGGVLSATIGIVYSFVYDGIYSWFYKVEDIVGNEVNLTSHNLTIDTVLPEIEYSFGTEDSGLIFERENIFVNVTAGDLYFSNLTFYLYDGEGLVFSNTPPVGISEINWTLLPDDEYYYNVTARDLAGNENSTQTRNITLDNLDPVISYSPLNEEDGAFISRERITVYVNAIEVNEENITFDLYNSTGYNIRSNTFMDGRRSVEWNLLGDGLYYYNVTIFDKVGHFDYTNTRSIILDNVDPQIEYGFGTELDGAAFSRDWIYFKVNVVEDNFKNVSLSLYNSTGLVSTQKFSDTTREYNWTELEDGNYWYNATTYDKAGNSESTPTRNIVLDNSNPLIDFTVGTEANNFNKTSDWIFVNVSLAEDNFGNISFSLFDEFGSVVSSQSYFDGTKNHNFTNLDSDVYYYNVSVYDSAGNFNNTETRKIGIDYLGPSIVLIDPKAKAYGYNLSLPLNYNVGDNIVGTDACWYNLDRGTNVTVDCSLGSSSFNTSNGQHTLHFYANDTFGNWNYKNVTFLISTTGPAIQLVEPSDNSFYAAAAEVFFNYTAEDPDLTESCSLYGSWNGVWHLNQTDYDWDERDSSIRTCSEIWGFDCGAGPPESGDNTFDGCSNGVGSDESVENIYLSDTIVVPGQEITVTCEFDPYTSSDDLFIWYYNGTNWEKLYEEYNMGSSVVINRSVGFVVDDVIGEQWVRCGIIYQGSGNDDECTDETTYGSDYFDNDDLNFTVIEPRTEGNFSVNLSEEGTHEWNVMCNDTKGYDTWAVENYSITFDVTDPVVDFGAGTLGDNSNVSQDWIYVNSSIIENNFDSIEFYLYDESSLVDSAWFNDSTRDYNFTGLDEGDYWYNLTVWDGANRNGSSPTRKVMLDTTPPTGNLGSPTDGSYVNNVTQNLTGSFSDENGLKEAILFIFNQTGMIDNFVLGLSGTSAVVGYVYNFLMDGIYEWFYQVEDSVGNLYNTTNSTIIVDTTLPIVNFVSSTLENDSYVSQNYVYLNLTINETNFDNMTFYLHDDEGLIYSNVYGLFRNEINWTLLSDDEYYYNVTVWDSAGNLNSSETRKVTLDNVLPIVSYASGTELNFANKSQNWIYVNTTVTEMNFDNMSFRLYNDEGLLDEVIFENETRDFNWTEFVLVQEEEYYYNVTVWDKAGQDKSLPTRKIILDTVSPLVDFDIGQDPSGSVFERDWISVQASPSTQDLYFKNISYRLYDNNSQLINETSFDSLVSEVNFSVSGENKTYFYEIVVYDWAGNNGTSDIRNITLIDVTNPSLVLTSPENVTYPYTDGIRLDYEVYDAHLDSCWYSLDGGANISLPNCNSKVFNFVDETSHTLDLYVNDTLGYLNSSSVSFSVNSSLIETPTYKVLRGSTFVDGSSTESIEITDMSKSFILHTSRGSGNGPDTLNVISDFSRSDEVEFSNYESGVGAIVDWSVISGPNISSQRGKISFGNENELFLNINPVNLSNSFIIVNAKLDSSVSSKNVEAFFSGRFVDDSNVIFERENGTESGVLNWQVVSWEGVNVQSGSVNISEGNKIVGSIIGPVNLNKSFLVFSRSLKGDNDVEDLFVKGVLENSTFVNFSRRGTGGNMSINYFIVSSEMFDVQRGEYAHLLTGDEQLIDLDYELKNIRRSFDIHSHENGIINTDFSKGFVTQNIEDNNSLRLDKDSSSGAGETGWFAIEILDLDSPSVDLVSPIEGYNYTSHVVGPFEYGIVDDSNMSNCSLYGSWNGWHLNQTLYGVDTENPIEFSSVDVGTSDFYNWSVECYDIYGNSYLTENRTFSSYLIPNEPEFVNISQTSNDGTGNIFLDWNDSAETVKYRIYYSDNMSDFVLLNETFDSNYTDVGFSGAKRRFYRVEAWNPSASNLSDYTFGAHVYELKHNLSSEHPIKNRNWIGFPTNFSYLNSASDALEEINGIVSIGYLNVSTQDIVTCNEFSCPGSFACTETACNFDFDFNAGRGYEVLLNESENNEVNWSGVGLVNEAVQVNLVYDETGTRFNKNWISMYAGTVLEDSSDLADSLLGEDAITSWNVDEQESEGWSRTWVSTPWYTGWLEFGEGFDIEIEKGYEVSVTQDSMWTQE